MYVILDGNIGMLRLRQAEKQTLNGVSGVGLSAVSLPTASVIRGVS